MKVTTQAGKLIRPIVALLLLCSSFAVGAVPISWVDWTSSTSDNGFTAFGTITTSTSTVDVTYNNPQGIAFFQDGVGTETDYWTRGPRDAATSPYTSPDPNGVDNIPTGTDMIALRFAGLQTLTFSEAIANPVFSYISLNANGYGFDQDFEILSFGDGSPDNACGFWGCGTSFKDVVATATGTEYQLLGTGEPHGTLRFSGAFDTVTWRSLSNEFWNGFTVGVQGTAIEILPCEVNPNLPECNGIPDPGPGPGPGPSPVAEPSVITLIALGLLGLGFARRREKS